MTDNENLDTDEGKKQNGYERQREKFQGKIDELQAQLEQERAGRITDKVSFFKATLTKEGYKGDFDAFASNYADKLSLDEMVALYKGTNGVTPPAQTQQSQVTGETENKIGPQSVIQGANPDKPMGGKSFDEMSLDELKQRGMNNPQIFNQGS